MTAVGAAGERAVPLRLGEALLAERVPELGLVGSITVVEREPFTAAWGEGAVPLVAPVARDGSGNRYLNVNADDVAAAVAAALEAEELVFLSDVPGVLAADGSVIAEISASAPPAVSGGMQPKLAACGAAVAAGVGLVRIGAGTVVTP
jgi:acetylglutamate kinase